MQTGLIALELAARLNKVDMDMRAVVREYGITEGEVSPDELVRIARHAGFRARLKELALSAIQGKYPLPAVALRKDGGYCVLLGVKDEDQTVLIYIPGEQGTTALPFAEFEELSAGRYIVLRHRLLSENVRFGFKWFYKEILNYKRIILEVMLGSFVVQLFGLVTPLFTQVILDKVIVHRSMTTLDVLAVAFGAIVVFELLLNLSRNYIFIHTINKIDAKLGSKLFKHLLSLPCMYFETRRVGDTIARVRELENIRNFVANKSVSVIIDLIFSVVFVVVMALYSVTLTLVVLGFVLVIGLLYLCITPELRRRLEDKFQMGARSNSYLVESVTGVQTVKSLAIEGAMHRKWEDHLGDYVNSNFRMQNMGNISGALAGSLRRLMTIVVLYLGVKLVIQNEMTIGQLIAFNMLSAQFTGPILRLVNLWNEFQQALLSVDRLSDILNHPPEVKAENAITLSQLKGAVRFDKVSFSYAPGAPMVLQDVSFTVTPGMRVGIVGRSGSGKSTLSKLLQRLYIPNAGSISVDGVDLNHMNPLWLRNNTGVVLQENYLFSGSIKDNIVMARPDAPMEMVLGVSNVAGAHEFVSRLPQGYDTAVGERGDSLSGGQRQRVAIARALITDPRILIFDEATSALDLESELVIRRNLAAIAKGRTMFIISHKLSIVRDCDLIIAMDDGKIVEMGRHEQLIERGGYYKRLHDLQGGVA